MGAAVNGKSAQTARAVLPHVPGMARQRQAGEAAGKLRALRERSGLSVREIAEKLGLPASSTYAGWESEYKKPFLPFDRAQRLARVMEGLGDPPIIEEEVLALAGVTKGVGDSDESRRRRPPSPGSLRLDEYDVRPRGGLGADSEPLDGNGHHPVVAEWMIPADYLRAYAADPGAVRIVRVAGDSMEPDYPAGERVAVDTSHTIPSPPGVYVLWDGYGLMLKRLEIILGTSPPAVRISSINAEAYPAYERALTDIRVQGRVIGKWTWR